MEITFGEKWEKFERFSTKYKSSPVRNGATAEVVKIVTECLEKRYDVKNRGIDDYHINFCKGCRTCHNTAKCVQNDDVDRIIEQYEWADIIISVSPSYWADIPWQFKAFSSGIDVNLRLTILVEVAFLGWCFFLSGYGNIKLQFQ